jgi:hypothetical protein
MVRRVPEVDEKLEKHVVREAARFGVRLVIAPVVGDHDLPAMQSCIERRSDGRHVISLTHRPVTPVAYLSALHEIGHAYVWAQPNAESYFAAQMRVFYTGRGERDEDEIAAWRWALRNARIPIDEAVRDAIGYFLSTHGIDAGKTLFRRRPAIRCRTRRAVVAR